MSRTTIKYSFATVFTPKQKTVMTVI